MKTEIKEVGLLCPYCEKHLFPEVEWTGDFIPDHMESGRDVQIHVFVCRHCNVQFVDPDELKERERIG